MATPERARGPLKAHKPASKAIELDFVRAPCLHHAKPKPCSNAAQRHPVPPNRPGAREHRAVRHSLVRARLYRGYPGRLVLCARDRALGGALGRKGATYG